jgi:hypothetical protein
LKHTFTTYYKALSLCSTLVLMLSITGFSMPIYKQVKIDVDDSITKKKDTTHCSYPCPRKAAILATVLPGAGQVYNKKYWKLPIVYGGLGVLTYLAVSNHIKFKKYKTGYLTAVDSIKGNETFTDSVVYSSQRLFTEQEQFHNRRDLFVLVSAAIYLASIVDALVDAHLAHFDVSDNLSMQIKPSVQPYYNFANSTIMCTNVGLTVNINIHNKRTTNFNSKSTIY